MEHPPFPHPELILVVDDDETVCDIMQQAIQRAGYQCFSAHNPRKALQMLDQYPLDVVVTDIRMPEMSGVELTKIIREKYDADVIMVTGLVEDFNYADIVCQGAADFIEKPLHLAEFTARVQRVLTERRVRADLQLNLNKLQQAMEGIVRMISMTVEMKDPYTAGHQQRVAELACAMAEAMGLPDEKVYGLRMASVIHDLGKMTVPSEILSKPGQLSPIEYELIKTHVQAGFDILKRIEFPWPLAEIVRHHHERLDGSGYPQGLSGDAIHPLARILAVADVFETIASHRPYRPAPGVSQAIAEIRQNSGILYDPAAASACLTLIEKNRFRFSAPPPHRPADNAPWARL